MALPRLFLLSQVLPFIIHSLPLTYFPKRTIWHWLRPVLFYNLTFTLADPAMPISPTYVAVGYLPLLMQGVGAKGVWLLQGVGAQKGAWLLQGVGAKRSVVITRGGGARGEGTKRGAVNTGICIGFQLWYGDSSCHLRRVSQKRVYTTVYDRIHNFSAAKKTVCTLHVRIYVKFNRTVCICTVYDRIHNFPAAKKTICTLHVRIHVKLDRTVCICTVYDRIHNFPAANKLYVHYIYTYT